MNNLRLAYEKAEEKAAQAHSTAVYMCNDRAWDVAAKAAKVAEQAYQVWMESEHTATVTYKPIHSIGQQIDHDGTWEVIHITPLGKLPNGRQSLDEFVQVRNVRKDGTLGAFSASFWALDGQWRMSQHSSHGAQK